MSLSKAGWFFSLLRDQGCRERSADGVVSDLRVMQVRGPRDDGRHLEGQLQWSLS